MKNSESHLYSNNKVEYERPGRALLSEYRVKLITDL
jgi:hypothetical protein